MVTIKASPTELTITNLSLQNGQLIEVLHSANWLESLLEFAHRRDHAQTSGPSLIESTGNTSLASATARVRTRVAVLPEQFQAAERLVRRRYQWRGYRVPSAENAEHSAARAVGQAMTLLAEDGRTLLGTLTVRPDSPEGLWAEQTYNSEVESLRRDGRRVGELVKLAVEEGADWKTALDALVQSAYLVTRVLHGLTDVLIEINPRHIRFYQRIFGFVVAAAERLCTRVGAPSVLMRLDLEQFGRRLQLSPV